MADQKNVQLLNQILRFSTGCSFGAYLHGLAWSQGSATLQLLSDTRYIATLHRLQQGTQRLLTSGCLSLRGWWQHLLLGGGANTFGRLAPWRWAKVAQPWQAAGVGRQ